MMLLNHKNSQIKRKKWFSKHNLSYDEATIVRLYTRRFIYPGIKFFDLSLVGFDSIHMKKLFNTLKLNTQHERNEKQKGIELMISRTIQVKRNYSITRCQHYLRGIYIQILFLKTILNCKIKSHFFYSLVFEFHKQKILSVKSKCLMLI